MRFLSTLSRDNDERLNGVNRVLASTASWTDEDWSVFCRAEDRGQLPVLRQMLAAEMADRIPVTFDGHAEVIGGRNGWSMAAKLNTALHYHGHPDTDVHP